MTNDKLVKELEAHAPSKGHMMARAAKALRRLSARRVKAVSDLAAARAEIERLKADLQKAHEDWQAEVAVIRCIADDSLVRAEEAEAERDEARAQVAAAYGAAADALQNVADNWDCGHNESRLCDCARDVEQWGFAADEVRVMTPADAKAALEAYGREKMREGMQRAADFLMNRPVYSDHAPIIIDAKNDILAEMEKLK